MISFHTELGKHWKDFLIGIFRIYSSLQSLCHICLGGKITEIPNSYMWAILYSQLVRSAAREA